MWDMWIIFLLAITMLTVPYALAFQSSVCGSQRGLGDTIFLWFMDACFWTDIFIHFNTAIILTDPFTCKIELVLDRREIARQYLKLWFWLDAFGSLPVQAIEDALSSGSCSLSSIKALRFNRLVIPSCLLLAPLSFPAPLLSLSPAPFAPSLAPANSDGRHD